MDIQEAMCITPMHWLFDGSRALAGANAEMRDNIWWPDIDTITLLVNIEMIYVLVSRCFGINASQELTS